MPLLKVARYVNATAGHLFVPHRSNYFRFIVRDNRIFYLSHFFPGYNETANSFYESAGCPLLTRYDSF